MTTLNRRAAEVVAGDDGVHAMTDVTGFGLMGHARELALGSGMRIELIVDQVPRMQGALDAIASRRHSRGLLANREFAECVSADAPGARIADDVRALLYDPQTAGGLLLSVAAGCSSELLQSLRHAGVAATKVGSVLGPYTAAGPAILLR